MKTLIKVILILGFLSQLGCSTFGKKIKAFLSGKPDPTLQAQESQLYRGKTFSSDPNYNKAPYREYKRVTKKTLEADADIGTNSGSLWTMEGQGAFLFSQNIVRMIGDPVTIVVEGDPKKQLDSKIKVIEELISKLEQRQKEAMARKLAGQQGVKKDDKENTSQSSEKTQVSETPKSDPNSDLIVTKIPTRVVEKMNDGNYRVKGSQPILIGQRQYKVIVTGVIRAEDFNDSGVESSKLLDSNFDIVSTKNPGAQL